LKQQSQSSTPAEQAPNTIPAEHTPLTKRHGTTRRLTRAEAALLDQRLAELCAQGTPGPELTKTLNREMGLKKTLYYYLARAKRRGLRWTRAVRVGRPGHRLRPVELSPEDERRCKHCGDVRVPVLYQLFSKPGQALLCENKCCPIPTCPEKLEVHEVLNKATGKVDARFWAHALPLHPRSCSVCGKEFTPANIKQAHKMTCSDPCMHIFATRNWQKSHLEQVREQNKQGGRRRQANVRLAGRLKNVEGLDLKTGLQVSLLAHRFLEGADLYGMRDGDVIYPGSQDPYSALRQLQSRFSSIVGIEQARIAALPVEQRQSEKLNLIARLRGEEAKPKKTVR
jgi:hypothetical protein